MKRNLLLPVSLTLTALCLVLRAQAMGNRCLSFMLFMLNFLFVKVCKHLIILVNELGECCARIHCHTYSLYALTFNIHAPKSAKAVKLKF
jgi:hypothetical protein